MTRRMSKGHTMDIVLAVLKQRGGNPALIDDFEKIVAEYEGRDRAFDAHKDNKRIERQRTMFAMMPDSTARDRFKESVINRAWELLDAGQADACDALLEFMPSADAYRMLDEYFKEDEV